jgi:hypothetical protein
MLNVTYAECHKYALYAECRYTECRNAECRGAVNYAFLALFTTVTIYYTRLELIKSIKLLKYI